MVLASPQHDSTSSSSSAPKRTTLGLLVSVSALMALCAKQASRVSNKLKAANKSTYKNNINKSPRHSPRLPLARPKQLLTQISNKAITLMHYKRRVEHENDDVLLGPDDFGDGGVWQKAILMGDKCEPLDFSGVIYYDSCGKQLNEIPLKSPRASPLPGYLTRAA